MICGDHTGEPGTTPNISGPIFFLGGHDLEMAEVIRVLRELSVPFLDRGLDWAHATFSAYEADIRAAIRKGKRPVLVELREIPADALPFVDLIDHHGPGSGDLPTSLEQVLAPLGVSTLTREQALIAANDKGYIDGMRAIGATSDEIVRIRRADRLAQGITHQQEVEAVAAVQVCLSLAPDLTLVNLPHQKTATVTDRLSSFAGGPGYDNLVIECPNEIDFFGDGKIVGELSAQFGGYCGGNLPKRGFWGLELGSVERSRDVRQFIIERITCSCVQPKPSRIG